MPEVNVPWVWMRLMHSLQALAMSADVQLSLFPDFVAKADELALDFDNFYQTALSNEFEISSGQQRLLGEIDSRFERMSGAENAEIWTPEALADRPEWQEVRNLATETLIAFGWPVDRPPSYPNEYVRG